MSLYFGGGINQLKSYGVLTYPITEATIMFWMQTNNLAVDEGMFEFSTLYYHLSFLIENGYIWFHDYFNNYPNFPIVSIDTNIHHLCGTYSQALNKGELFIDGISVGSLSPFSLDNNVDGSSKLTWGGYGDNVYGYSGKLWNTKIYNRVLNANEIKNEYITKGANNNIFGLKQWLLMDDKSNGFVTYNSFNGIKDISGNGHNCICYNAPVFSDSPTKLHSGRR